MTEEVNWSLSFLQFNLPCSVGVPLIKETCFLLRNIWHFFHVFFFWQNPGYFDAPVDPFEGKVNPFWMCSSRPGQIGLTQLRGRSQTGDFYQLTPLRYQLISLREKLRVEWKVLTSWRHDLIERKFNSAEGDVLTRRLCTRRGEGAKSRVLKQLEQLSAFVWKFALS